LQYSLKSTCGPQFSTTCCSSSSILSGWAMSLSLFFLWESACVCGFSSSGGGGGGGGGGGASARSTVVFGRSSCSISQSDFAHIARNSAATNARQPVNSAGAHLGIFMFLAALKLWNIAVGGAVMCGPAER